MSIRRLTEKDMPQVAPILEAHKSPQFNWSAAELEVEIVQHEAWGVFEDLTLMAFLVLHFTASAIEVPVLVTHPGELGRGHMTKLLEWLFYTKGQSQQVWLEVHQANLPANRLAVVCDSFVVFHLGTPSVAATIVNVNIFGI